MRGEGVYIIDEQGERYLDLLSGIGVNALGYGHPVIEEAIARQSRALIHTSNLYFHEGQAELALRLTERTGLDRVFFANTGTEAWEGALKLARAYAGLLRSEGKQIGTKFLALEQSFHGRTFGSMSATYKEKYREPFAPVVPGVEFVQFQRRCRSARQIFQRGLRHSRRGHPGRGRRPSAHAGVLRRGARAGQLHRSFADRG